LFLRRIVRVGSRLKCAFVHVELQVGKEEDGDPKKQEGYTTDRWPSVPSQGTWE